MLSRLVILLSMGLEMAATSCGSSSKDCPAFAVVHSLAVTVLDQATGSPVCDASVTARNTITGRSTKFVQSVNLQPHGARFRSFLQGHGATPLQHDGATREGGVTEFFCRVMGPAFAGSWDQPG
jgi:hypothetical protein